MKNEQIATSANSLKRAMGAINRALLREEFARRRAPGVFSDERIAELQACNVILMRAVQDLWSAYDVPKR